MTQRSDSLKTKLAEHQLLLADKSRENKHLHEELSRVTAVLDVKLNEIEALHATVADVQHQLKMGESERDLLAVMLNEAENAQTRLDSDKFTAKAAQEQERRLAAKEKSPDDNLFHWVLDSVPVGIAVVSPAGMILSANKQLLHVTGFSLVDLFGKEVCVLFEEHKGNTGLMKNLIESAGTLAEARIKRKDRSGFLAAVVLRRMAVLPDKRIFLCILDLAEVRQPLSFD